MRAAAGVVLIGWALWHALYGHRQRLRVGMQTGLAGLALWSFLMASAHGAGLMLIPVLLPLCAVARAAGMDRGRRDSARRSPRSAFIPLAMLAAIAAYRVVVYEWVGVGFLRRGWINLDLVWVAALVVCGLVLLAALASRSAHDAERRPREEVATRSRQSIS